MSKRVKGLIEKEFKSRFDGLTEWVVVSMRGIDGNSNNELRGQLLEKDIRVTVVKNSLARRAFTELGMEGIDDMLSGPCAIAAGADNIVDLTKELIEWDKKLDNFEIKGAYLDGQAMDQKAAKEIAKWPTRAELQATVVMIAMSPGSRVVGAATSPASTIAGCIKTIIDNKEEAA